QQVTAPPQGSSSPAQAGDPQTLLLQTPLQQSAPTMQTSPSDAQVLVPVVRVSVTVPCPPSPVDPLDTLVLGLPMPSWLGPPGSLGPGGISVAGSLPFEQPAA